MQIVTIKYIMLNVVMVSVVMMNVMAHNLPNLTQYHRKTLKQYKNALQKRIEKSDV
jgi:hypothetical protein